MSVLAPTTVTTAASLQATFNPAAQMYKALLFATGEPAPFIVQVSIPAVTLPGAPLGGLQYMPWLTGTATAGPANHSYLELAVFLDGRDRETMTVIMTDQDHPPHLVLPRNKCIENVTGVGTKWNGNVLVVRHDAGRLADVKHEHIRPILESIAILIRAELSGAKSAMSLKGSALQPNTWQGPNLCQISADLFKMSHFLDVNAPDDDAPPAYSALEDDEDATLVGTDTGAPAEDCACSVDHNTGARTSTGDNRSVTAVYGFEGGSYPGDGEFDALALYAAADDSSGGDRFESRAAAEDRPGAPIRPAPSRTFARVGRVLRSVGRRLRRFFPK
ncbi:hypothetical protein B0H15DRAFT_957689 [Mycena belliarum]|uniref:Uncharacterized protein n=1 Tax=Mycena belliarum TaxID=1033014 RepID=A0AAD6TS82_9AGAR|nr:hypothetical protein B0H15DRAFT_957689 [Mycena belliae]